MSLETDLKRIADALEAVVELVRYPLQTVSAKGADVLGAPELGPAPEVSKPAKTARKTASAAAPAAPGAPQPTLDDLTDVLRELVTAKGAPVARAVLQKFGADKISTVKPENYQAVYDAMKAAKA